MPHYQPNQSNAAMALHPPLTSFVTFPGVVGLRLCVTFVFCACVLLVCITCVSHGACVYYLCVLLVPTMLLVCVSRTS